MFHMAFHLPYCAWRPSCQPDHRHDEDEPLRHIRDVSFLDWKNSERSGYLHEGQISCVVAGPDEYLWTAYCFADVYFETDKTKELLFPSNQPNNLPKSMRMDPFRNGKTIADNEFRNPREFFLAVLSVRFTQVTNEWLRVVEKLQESVRGYKQVCPPPFFFFTLMRRALVP